jgi:hypothetical protein
VINENRKSAATTEENSKKTGEDDATPSLYGVSDLCISE